MAQFHMVTKTRGIIDVITSSLTSKLPMKIIRTSGRNLLESWETSTKIRSQEI